MRRFRLVPVLVIGWALSTWAERLPADETMHLKEHRLRYGSPESAVDLGVGLWAWPLPMDWDGDGHLDLVVTCADTPFAGTYLFRNPGPSVGGARSRTDPGPDKGRMPVFEPPVRVGPKFSNPQISYVEGQPRILSRGEELVDFRKNRFEKKVRIHHSDSVHVSQGRIRANQWRYVDYNGNGVYDLVVGVGDWADYGWDDAFDERGNWTNGPLHGYVYLLRNDGTNDEPKYAEPRKVEAGGRSVDVYGMPSPNFADFDGDGDLDLLCGEFLDGFTYFENVGTREEPLYARGRRLTSGGEPLAMDLQMITPVAIDWTGNGHVDLVVGDEDGRVALIEHTGRVTEGMPQFLPPRYFQQQADLVKFGALVTPHGVDWDGDGHQDLICGNTAGHIGFIKNLDGGYPPRWASPQLLEVDGEPIRVQAGRNGSIQGPCEAKWGYTTLTVADWNHNGLPDIIINSIWGKVEWFENVGTRTEPKLAAAKPIEVAWPAASKPPKPAWNWWDPQGNELVTQWRTTPYVIDLDGDGLNDLVMLDHEGYLAFFRRKEVGDQWILEPGERIFRDTAGDPLHLNDGWAGKSGRRKFCFVDWDGDGRLDLMLNSANATFLRNVSTPEKPWTFEDMGPVSGTRLAGHTTSPTAVNWNPDGRPDLVIGGEDGHLYFIPNPARAPEVAR